jgi:hypothetical protein
MTRILLFEKNPVPIICDWYISIHNLYWDRDHGWYWLSLLTVTKRSGCRPLIKTLVENRKKNYNTEYTGLSRYS